VKSAALAHPDGTHGLIYCVDAPESRLEDMGIGALVGGTAEVELPTLTPPTIPPPHVPDLPPPPAPSML
jgi:hypothetical protein